MICPICEKRKAKRLCPAKAQSICPECCGREREVTIDCPPDCTYLIASREFGAERREDIDWSKVPFSDQKPRSSVVQNHVALILYLCYAIDECRVENRSMVDSDAQASLQALAESYRTLSSGIYFERPPDYALQRGLYDRLKEAITEFRRDESTKGTIAPVRDSEIRDCLIFMTQASVLRSNGRPKGRAFLDFVNRQLPPEESAKIITPSIVLP